MPIVWKHVAHLCAREALNLSVSSLIIFDVIPGHLIEVVQSETVPPNNE